MSHKDDARSRADREATDWLIRLGEADDEAAYAAFETWIVASSVNAEAWVETSRTSQKIAAAVERPAPRPVRRSRPVRPRLPVTRGGRKSWVAAFAASAAAVLFAASVAPDTTLRLRSDYMTGVRQLRTVRLEDGSLVTLGPKSAVSVDYRGKERRIKLLSGVAYFEVTHNPDRPFRVLSPLLQTTVLGTAFEVGSIQDKGVVGVRRGRVRVETPAKATRTLAPGDGVRTGPDGVLRAFETDPDNIAAWTRKRLIVEARPAAEVVDALRPWYGGIILARGARLETARVTGVYDLMDPVGALIAVSRANGASVQRVSPWLMVISFD